MDKIVLLGLEFHGYHGVFPVEAEFGARFIVDLELFACLPKKDDLEETVDYSAVYASVRDEVADKRYELIETLAHTIAGRILDEQTLVQTVIARVHKPHAPLPGVVRDVYVEVTHHRRATD